ncbi:response regulator [Desulfonema magnum]|uniref:Oxygen sensor histidine kinase NreB n=1 Tax=Desulfonema magnum TaxID=45655 RepID=A0A975BWS5_9BACT|nr:response regulator [Desulfonema magnum]QTA93113.1 Two component system response regulator/histidine kinase, PAS domain-containing [Desulfonema magnum]
MGQYEILLVDDDPLILKMTDEFLKSQGYDITAVSDGASAIEVTDQKNFDLVLTDLVMEPVDGLSVLRHAKKRNPETMVIIMTGFGDMDSAIHALRLNADDYILKPCELTEICARVSICLDKLKLRQKIRTDREKHYESLCKAHENLELKVEQRTAELVRTNDQLKREIEERKRMEKILSMYELIISTIRDKMAFIDRNYIYRTVNNAYTKYHNKPKDKIEGHSVAELLGTEIFENSVKDYLDRCLAGEEIHYQEWFVFADGKPRFMDVGYYPLIENGGSVSGVAVSSRNITNIKQTEEMLRKRTQELSERVKELNCLYCIFKLLEKKDVPLNEMLQEIVSHIPSGWQYPEKTCTRLILEGQEFKTENFTETAHRQYCNIHIGGQQIGVLEVCYLDENLEKDECPLLKEEQNLISAIADRLGKTIEHNRADEALERMNEQLLAEHYQRKELSKRLIDLLEKDRKNVAMELHDQIGQTLTSLKICLELVRNVKNNRTELEAGIKNAKNKASQAIRELKNIFHGLRPAMLDTLGLVPALRELFNEIENQTEIEIRFFYSKNFPKHFDKKQEIALYRIAQEALNNAVKYAKAKEVFVNLILKNQSISVSIEDDGIGFDPETVMADQKKGKRLGLVFMRERVIQLNGEFQIESREGGGTHLLAEIPL